MTESSDAHTDTSEAAQRAEAEFSAYAQEYENTMNELISSADEGFDRLFSDEK